MRDGKGLEPLLHPAIAKRGRLELEFAQDPNGKTYIHRQFSSYPFHICRPFYLDDGPCSGMATVYTQSCSGGLYGLDTLKTQVKVQSGAQAHLTTQASTIVHKATDGVTEQNCDITLEDDALFGYSPDPTILFPGAHLKSSVNVALSTSASMILFDSFLPHDFEGESNLFELIDNTVSITSPAGTPLVIDRFQVSGAAFRNCGIGTWGKCACHGSVIIVAPNVDNVAELIETARHRTIDMVGGEIGISKLPCVNGISARILSSDAVPMKLAMQRLWEIAFEAITGHSPKPRRK